MPEARQTNALTETDTLVIGGGVVGAAIAYGLSRAGETVRLLDDGDAAFRASRGNFGLVWVQGKGADHPGYGRWSMDGATRWQQLADDLAQQTGINVMLSQPGGFSLCLSEAEKEQRLHSMHEVARVIGRTYPYEWLDPAQLRLLEPAIGPQVLGAVYCPLDGHVSPLRVMRALMQALALNGVAVQAGRRVSAIACRGRQFHVTAGAHDYVAGKVILAAGLGNRDLAPLIGLTAPVKPVRGQLLVTERVAAFLRHPCLQIRQTDEGVVQMGDTREEVGFNDSTTLMELARIARRAVRCFPHLERVNVVRSWGSLRVMTPDGNPIYQQSGQFPGAYLVSCHSGLTLATMHAGPLVDWMRGGPQPADIASLTSERFDV